MAIHGEGYHMEEDRIVDVDGRPVDLSGFSYGDQFEAEELKKLEELMARLGDHFDDLYPTDVAPFAPPDSCQPDSRQIRSHVD